MLGPAVAASPRQALPAGKGQAPGPAPRAATAGQGLAAGPSTPARGKQADLPAHPHHCKTFGMQLPRVCHP